MKFEFKDDKDVTLITVEGGMIGGPAASQLLENLRDLIEKGKKQFIINMEKVEWMNSSGLGILIGSLTAVRNHGGELKLLHLPKKVRDLLQITKLDRVFEIFDNEEAAVDSFAQ